MFEVNVKNVTESREGGEGRGGGPAWVWGSDDKVSANKYKKSREWCESK